MSTVDLGLGDAVTLRLVGACEADSAAVQRQTGLRVTATATEPHLVVRFVPHLPVQTLRLVGTHLGCVPDGVVVSTGDAGPGRRTYLPLTSLADGAGPPEVLCEAGSGPVALVVELVNLVALRRGLLALHAAAVDIDGTGVVVTGWSKGGKTETVLGVMAESDATFIADEWLYIDPVRRIVLGSAHPMRLWEWHVQQLPHLVDRIPEKDRRRFRTVRGVRRLRAHVPARVVETSPVKFLDAVMPLLERRAGVHLPPDGLFDGRVRATAPFDRLIHVVSWSRADYELETVSSSWVAARMSWSLRTERRALTDAYDALRFAYPDAISPWLDDAVARESHLMAKAFDRVDAMELRHPHPVSIRHLARHVLQAGG